MTDVKTKSRSRNVQGKVPKAQDEKNAPPNCQGRQRNPTRMTQQEHLKEGMWRNVWRAGS